MTLQDIAAILQKIQDRLDKLEHPASNVVPIQSESAAEQATGSKDAPRKLALKKVAGLAKPRGLHLSSYREVAVDIWETTEFSKDETMATNSGASFPCSAEFASFIETIEAMPLAEPEAETASQRAVSL